MPQDLQTCVVKILKQDGTIAGTGFVVAQRMAVTCTHVVELADGEPGEGVEVEFYHGGKNTLPSQPTCSNWGGALRSWNRCETKMNLIPKSVSITSS
jgi:hypothetical protein